MWATICRAVHEECCGVYYKLICHFYQLVTVHDFNFLVCLYTIFGSIFSPPLQDVLFPTIQSCIPL